MPVKWLRKALKSLEQTHQFIAEDNLETAIRIVLKIQAAVDQLEKFPMLGRVGRVEDTRELIISNSPFIVVYRVKGKTVQILRVLHTSKQYPD